MTYCVREEYKKYRRYKIVLKTTTGEFDILNDIIDRVELVKLIDTAVNVNHAISIAGCWMSDSN